MLTQLVIVFVGSLYEEFYLKLCKFKILYNESDTGESCRFILKHITRFIELIFVLIHGYREFFKAHGMLRLQN